MRRHQLIVKRRSGFSKQAGSELFWGGQALRANTPAEDCRESSAGAIRLLTLYVAAGILKKRLVVALSECTIICWYARTDAYRLRWSKRSLGSLFKATALTGGAASAQCSFTKHRSAALLRPSYSPITLPGIRAGAVAA